MRNKWLWGLMTLFSLLTVLLISRYLTLDPDLFFPEQRAVYMVHLTALIIHAIATIHEHRHWMVRNFALTLAGVMLRLQSPMLGMALEFETAYKIVAWSSWSPNLLVAEWLLKPPRPVVGRITAQTDTAYL